MDAFLYSVTWHYMLFAKTGNGDIWRIWFNGPEPLMQKLIGNEPEFREPLAQLAAAAGKLPHKESIAREVRRAMLDNPTDGKFNARAEKREKIADDTADVILGLFRRLEQGSRK